MDVLTRAERCSAHLRFGSGVRARGAAMEGPGTLADTCPLATATRGTALGPRLPFLPHPVLFQTQ